MNCQKYLYKGFNLQSWRASIPSHKWNMHRRNPAHFVIVTIRFHIVWRLGRSIFTELPSASQVFKVSRQYEYLISNVCWQCVGVNKFSIVRSSIEQPCLSKVKARNLKSACSSLTTRSCLKCVFFKYKFSHAMILDWRGYILWLDQVSS